MIPFVDYELYKKIKKKLKDKPTVKEEYPEQEFLAACLKVGLTLKDLEEITYIEAQKILYSFIEKETEPKVRKATQEDWDRLM